MQAMACGECLGFVPRACERQQKIAQQLGGMTVSDVGNSSKTQEEEIKRLPGGKIKKKEKLEVLVERVTRNKRKCLTTIKGLDMFGVKLADASKKLGKKFASGASVVKGPTEKEQIDVQGDILLDIVEFITETWQNIPESAIYFIEDGKKVPAC
ncbi:density-regulated protein homolog isoform X2 [Selaginella moellendorffii]|uniref:density-regulated protein homolog isoform X2 n=1 Tax=Selaginella moellendorffii TaxID=88036 RepID=UPI000D1C83E2|nr:density-regulated protein homolog isoform X2 [Selaginella moellendorffii]|eukprot:XP_024516711.1 density-regulated protein homolog isoform X2 [Selaginella moellendorffii]